MSHGLQCTEYFATEADRSAGLSAELIAKLNITVLCRLVLTGYSPDPSPLFPIKSHANVIPEYNLSSSILFTDDNK